MTVGEIYTPDCAADLGDARCGVDLSALEMGGSVTSVTSDTSFEASLAQPSGWYDGGELIWTAGANTGQTVAVRRWDAGAGTLSQRSSLSRSAMPSPSARAATRASRPVGRNSIMPSTSAAIRMPPVTTRSSAILMRKADLAEKESDDLVHFLSYAFLWPRHRGVVSYIHCASSQEPST